MQCGKYYGWTGRRQGHEGQKRGRWANHRTIRKRKTLGGQLGTGYQDPVSPAAERARGRPRASSTRAHWGHGCRKPAQKTVIHLSRARRSERRCASQPATPRSAAGELDPTQPPSPPPPGESRGPAHVHAGGAPGSTHARRGWGGPAAGPSVRQFQRF